MRTGLIAAVLASALVILPASEAFARGGFRGGGFRAPSIHSVGSSRSFAGWGSATKPTLQTSTPRLGGISGGRASISTQRGLYDSARRSGTIFSSKDEARAAFKSRYANDYASTFASEPSVRPSYIPSSALVDGRNVNIVYNPALGGYGYLHPTLGRWLLFDALAQSSTLDYVMSNRGYYWGGAPVIITEYVAEAPDCGPSLPTPSSWSSRKAGCGPTAPSPRRAATSLSFWERFWGRGTSSTFGRREDLGPEILLVPEAVGPTLYHPDLGFESSTKPRESFSTRRQYAASLILRLWWGSSQSR
jgi:hypothetical protein